MFSLTRPVVNVRKCWRPFWPLLFHERCSGGAKKNCRSSFGGIQRGTILAILFPPYRFSWYVQLPAAKRSIGITEDFQFVNHGTNLKRFVRKGLRWKFCLVTFFLWSIFLDYRQTIIYGLYTSRKISSPSEELRWYVSDHGTGVRSSS